MDKDFKKYLIEGEISSHGISEIHAKKALSILLHSLNNTKIVIEENGEIVGFTSSEDYEYIAKAIKDGKHVGNYLRYKGILNKIVYVEEADKKYCLFIDISDQEQLMISKTIEALSGSKFIVTDMNGDIIYPLSPDSLLEAEDILSRKSDASDEIYVQHEIYKYSEKEQELTVYEDPLKYNVKILEDITKDKDFLTHLNSKLSATRQIDEYLEEVIGRNREFTYVFMDVDKFKTINDTHGHTAGDNALEYLGKVLNANVRDTDVAFRYAGDEFGILFKDISLEDVIKKVNKIRETYEKLDIPGIEERHTISVGVCHAKGTLFDRNKYFKDKENDVPEMETIGGIREQLRNIADESEIASKSYGGNCITINNQIDGSVFVINGVNSSKKI